MMRPMARITIPLHPLTNYYNRTRKAKPNTMQQEMVEVHELDEHRHPAGGKTLGKGIEIHWQDGPLGRGPDRKEPNGAFVEGVIKAALGRLEFYQESEFRCEENDDAIGYLEAALGALERRTIDRTDREVEGTHDI